MNPYSNLKSLSLLKKVLIVSLVALIATLLTLSVRVIRKNSRHSSTPLSVESLLTTWPSAEYQSTDQAKFGEDGVHYFSNLYYKAQQFLIAGTPPSNLSDLNFFGDGEYAYKVKPFSQTYFSKLARSSSPYKVKGTTLILASSKEMKSLQPHYFHFLEEFILGWAAHKDLNTPTISTVIFPDIDHWQGVNQINQQILQATLPNVTILNKTQFKELTDKNLIQFEQAIVVDRQGCHNLKPVTTYNKMVLGHAELIKNQYLKEMRDAVLAKLKTHEVTHRARTITYINRKNRRYLEPTFEKKFLQSLRKNFPDHKVQAVWFEKMSYAQQLQIVRNTDILIGAHGNGLTHSYFLPDNALVLEIFPQGAFAMDYQLISELSGHDYYAIEPNEGIISFAGHHMQPRGNVNQVISEFDMNWVISPIQQHIQRLEEIGAEKESSSLE